MKQIYYGPEIWNLQNSGGISRYFYELINGNTKSAVPLINENKNYFAAQLHSQSIRLDRAVSLSEIYQTGESNQLGKELSGRVFHPTYYGSKLFADFKKTGVPVVITVFDMISEIFPERRSFRNFFKNVKASDIRSADHIICISEKTREDLVRFFPAVETKTSVVHLGIDKVFSLASHGARPNYKKPYLLYVGNRRGYKNFKVLYLAYMNSVFLRKNFALVAFGGEKYTDDEFYSFARPSEENPVIFVSGDDEMLANYYRNAAAFIYPSLYEGFGLPPLEAMACGALTFTSNRGSLPEVCQDSSIYFDPENVVELQELLELWLTPNFETRHQIEIGIAHARKFTWRKTVDQTKLVYDKLI
jgi:glycosyltransferase involved in cell wall biosynthesis